MLDDIGFGNYGTGGLNPPTNAPINASGSAAGTPSPFLISSVQESDLEALALLMVAGAPVLMMPDINGNSSPVNASSIAAAVGMSTEAKIHEIISKMWDSYIENIREIAERQKKEDIKDQTEDANKAGPMSGAAYLAYLMSISPTQRAEEVEGSAGVSALTTQFTNTYNTWLVNPIDSGTVAGIAGAYPSASFVAGCVACNPDAIRNAIGADGAVLGIQLSVSPVADALSGVGPASGLPGDYQAAAAMVAALLNGGAVNKATADTIANPAGSAQEYDLNFAVNYAQQIMAIVTKNIGDDQTTDPNRASQNKMVRLMLCVMALNLVYRTAYGGMNALDFASLLARDPGNLGKIEGTLKQLLDLIDFNLPEDPQAKADTINSLMEYIDSNDSVLSMLQTTRMFASFLKTSELDAQRLASSR